uniref:Uncharacterized protein n=1 Tax=Glossina austeni TaxID=7395 RepID=A0A1A9VGF9_GLOAU
MRSQENQAASHMRPKHNKSSSLLTHEENEAVFKMLGRKCQIVLLLPSVKINKRLANSGTQAFYSIMLWGDFEKSPI